jgi:hypothetical protein
MYRAHVVKAWDRIDKQPALACIPDWKALQTDSRWCSDYSLAPFIQSLPDRYLSPAYSWVKNVGVVE